ncbi:MAG: peptidoglycan DD-metalloendopeptidase family protein [Formivibrio sp.]|nr:peptidoglycan DD-metalloendopeptidase family protein [Formivibrio sp.]
MSRFQYSLIILLLLAGCAAQQPAPIVERALSGPKSSQIPTAQTTVAKPLAEPASGTYVVKKGDTLYHIALDHGLAYRDLAGWNNLNDNFDIKVDQTLRLTAPDTPDGVEVRPLQDIPSVVPASSVAAPASVGVRAYPKALKLPYGSQTAEAIGKQAEGPVVAYKAAELNQTIAASSPKTISSKPSAVIMSTPDKTNNKEQVAANSSDENVINWMPPTAGKLLKPYTEDDKGVDFSGKMGQPVLAAGSGKVVYAGSGLRGYGKMVIIKHNSAYLSAYAHNSKLLVKEGDAVKRGEKIAEMGNSDTDQVKLHFEIRKFGKPVDPTKFITADKS